MPWIQHATFDIEQILKEKKHTAIKRIHIQYEGI